jgi:hypothetical protein
MWDGVDRKHSRDGERRAKPGPELSALFLARIRVASHGLDKAIQDLQRVH